MKRQKRMRSPVGSRNESAPTIVPSTTTTQTKTNIVAQDAPKTKKSKKEPTTRKKVLSSIAKNTMKPGYSAHLTPDVVDALQRDDDEIAALRSKLGLGKGRGKDSSSNKRKLNKEYAKLEGYGDDFGDFLEDLDDMVHRVAGGHAITDEEGEEEESLSQPDDGDMDGGDDDDDDDPNIATGFERDDAEIEELERKLSIGKNKKEKARLYKEYQLEGYGDDFGDFLDGLDDMVKRVSNPKSSKDYEKKLKQGTLSDDDAKFNDDESEVSEETVPLKDPAYEELDEDDSVLKELEREEDEGKDDDAIIVAKDDAGFTDVPSDDDSAMGDESAEDDDDDDDDNAEEPDHDISDTYRPSQGEDIYGNKVDDGGGGDAKPATYIPPHLRTKLVASDDIEDAEKRQAIRRGLNNALNRLSDDTLVSVAQQLAQLYRQHPTQMVHELLWRNTKDACVLVPILMKGMIPAYIACIIGVHIQSNDTVQIGEFVLEAVVAELWAELEVFRRRCNSDDTEVQGLPVEILSKHICNRMLILCYLYNFNIVHCSFMYDVIRHLIKKFSEVDIECLLLLLSHCGRSLRSDDPLALKEIVLLVQKKNSEIRDQESSSRAEYMVAAITHLKNNKRGKQDTVYGEKTSKLRKILGQIKSTAAKSNTAKAASEATLRISLEDILSAETKGRWWKVGASWIGNQYRFNSDSQHNANDSDNESPSKPSSSHSEQDEALLKLATKLRMNTDRKRAIFCIIMGSEDCEDAFEKLCRGSMLQNKSERDACRVLLECCLNEKVYNKFYGHLAARMCEFQPQCKFSMQLAFWDIFKQFDSMDARKAANLAKFLFHLTVTHEILRLMTVLKAMDISEDDMQPSAQIFLTILMTSILSHFHDTGPLKAMFGARHSDHEDETRHEQEEGARASLLVFFMETLKASPKNVKGSEFRKNFKATVKALDTDGFESML